MGFWGGLGKVLGVAGGIAGAPFTGGASLIPSLIGAGGAALGAISQGKAQNRGAEFGGQMDLEQLLMARDQQQFGNSLAREQEGRAGSSDAWRKLLAAQRVASPGARPQLSPYSMAPRQSTGAELQGADALTQEVLARLQGGNPIAAPVQRPMAVDPELLKAGWLEKLAGYGGAGMSAYGALSRMRPQGRSNA
jgi:hypothetical protein